MNALAALGLDYGSDDDESEDDSVPHQPAPSLAPAPVSRSESKAASNGTALPDATSLLLDLPDEVDWDARPDESDEVQHDAKGTKYNAVALPASMASEQDAFNARTGGAARLGKRGGHQTAAAVTAGLAAIDAATGTGNSDGMVNSAVARTNVPKGTANSSRASGMLVPPQLRRGPNVTTEELSSMRTLKRPKVQK